MKMSRFISWREYFLFNLVAAMLITMSACDQKPSPIEPPGSGTLPNAPISLTIAIGDGVVYLSWSYGKAGRVSYYKIYRSEATANNFALLDTAAATRYSDHTAQNGLTYYYQVSAVDRQGFESPRTGALAANPNVYTLLIENGADFTNNKNVTIRINAPQTTSLMQISNDSTFAGAVWKPFSATIAWTLSLGDGLKTVYAKFRDAADVESYPPAKDTIVLDTQAAIASVTEDTGGKPKRMGEKIHFALDAGEPDGTAAVNITGGPQNIALFDDGQSGDPVPGDGIYELDYTIPDGVDVFQTSVRGTFVDRVGNVALDKFADTRLTILKEPAEITLFQPVPAGDGKTSLKLTWTQSPDAHDFANYSLYRSSKANITQSNSTLLDIITRRNSINFTDTGLSPATKYYYRIFVTDATGLTTPSNEVSGQTAAQQPPLPVVLFQPLLLPNNVINITWSQNTQADFASYRVYRATTPGVVLDSDLRAIITKASQTSFNDVDLQQGTTYYYRIFVFDTFAQSSGSNEETITLPANLPPDPVVLSQPAPRDTTRLVLTWSQSTAPDFSYYSVYRSLTSPVDTTASPIVFLNGNRLNTQYVDSGLQPRTTYYYRVFVVDTGGLQAGSAEVAGTTQ